MTGTHLDASELRALAVLLDHLSEHGRGHDQETGCHVTSAHAHFPTTGGNVRLELEDGSWVVTYLATVTE